MKLRVFIMAMLLVTNLNAIGDVRPISKVAVYTDIHENLYTESESSTSAEQKPVEAKLESQERPIGRCYTIYDPFEKTNRRIFAFNRAIDQSLVRPFVKIYSNAMPEWGQQRVNSFFYNIKEPLSFLNYIMQGNVQQASQTFWRFFVNTTFGLGGLFDFASKFDLQVKQQTLSNTMAHYGMNYGAYLVIPIFGPSTPRDLFGKVVDTLTDPVSIVWTRQYKRVFNWKRPHYWSPTTSEYNTATAAQVRIKNDQLLYDIEDSSLDTYAKVRSLYLQSLAGQDPRCEQELVNIKYE